MVANVESVSSTVDKYSPDIGSMYMFARHVCLSICYTVKQVVFNQFITTPNYSYGGINVYFKGDLSPLI